MDADADQRGPDEVDVENNDVAGVPADGGPWIERRYSSFMDRADDGELREPLLLRRRTMGKNTTSQLAIIGANICPIESLDYEIVENDLFKQDWRSRNKIQIFQYVVLKWTLALLIGLGTGLVGFFNNLAVENIAGLKLLLLNYLMLQDRYYLAFIVYAGCNLILAAAAASLCAYVAPAAAGSGIPEVKAYLNGVDAHSILAPSTLFVKDLQMRTKIGWGREGLDGLYYLDAEPHCYKAGLSSSISPPIVFACYSSICN